MGKGNVRYVEFYVGKSWGGDSGEWWVESVEVDSNWDRDWAIEEAKKEMRARLEARGEDVAFWGLYHFQEE